MDAQVVSAIWSAGAVVVSALISGSAQNGEKDKLYYLACALENGDVDNVRSILSEL